MQVNDMRKLMEAAVDKLTPAKARELAKQLLEGANREQLQKAQQDLLKWSSHNRERITSLVTQEVKRQLKSAGFATREEVESLRKRVRTLEHGGPVKKSTAKKSTAKKSPAKKSPAKRASATESGGPGGADS
ncbi:MAG: hypothetical protein WEA10_07560 [Actinomycetota bacterium]